MMTNRAETETICEQPFFHSDVAQSFFTAYIRQLANYTDVTGLKYAEQEESHARAR